MTRLRKIMVSYGPDDLEIYEVGSDLKAIYLYDQATPFARIEYSSRQLVVCLGNARSYTVWMEGRTDD